MNNYYNDDLLQHCLILWIMALLVAHGNNTNLVAEPVGTVRTTVGSYACARLTLALTYRVYGFASTEHRP